MKPAVAFVACLVVFVSLAAPALADGPSPSPTTMPAGHASMDHDMGSMGATDRDPDGSAGRALADRLAAAAPGDTVVVDAGYHRGNFVVHTPITLRGEGLAMLDGGGHGTVLTIAADAAGTVVTGLHVLGSGAGPVDTPSGIRIEADDVTVEGVQVTDTYMGIQAMGVTNARIAGNSIAGYADGAVTGELHATEGEADMTGMAHANSAASGGKLRGDAVTLFNTSAAVVERNEVRSARDGVFMSFADHSAIRANDIRDSRYAIHAMYASELDAEANHFEGNLAGAILMYGGPFAIRGNTILKSKSPSTGIGLVLKDGSGATVSDNVVAGNRVGIKLDNGGAASAVADPAVVRSNTIGLNQVGVEIMQATRAEFSRNSFVDNTVQVVTDGDSSKVSWTIDDTGNYWSTYKGYDTEGDGVGDLPFIEGGSIENTLVRSPVLTALVSGPAFRMLQAIEDRWAPDDPVVLDPRPMTRSQSPSYDGADQPERTTLPFGLVGFAVAGGSAMALFRARRPRPRLRHA